MRLVHLDSMLHYQLKQDGDRLLLLEYGTGDDRDDFNYDLCPGMQQRGPFKPEEGRVIEEFSEGEQVEFVYSSFSSILRGDLADERVFCGDDLRYHLGARAEAEDAEGEETED